MTIALYFDEDSARISLIRELRARGADVISAVEAGLVGKRGDDEVQLEWAACNRRAIFSFNRGDFYCLHTNWMAAERSHWGIILSRQDLSVGELMRRLLRLIANKRAEEMRNQVEFLSGWR